MPNFNEIVMTVFKVYYYSASGVSGYRPTKSRKKVSGLSKVGGLAIGLNIAVKYPKKVICWQKGAVLIPWTSPPLLFHEIT